MIPNPDFHQEIAVIPTTGKNLVDLDISDDGRSLFVTSFYTNELLTIDTVSLQQQQRVSVSRQPWMVEFFKMDGPVVFSASAASPAVISQIDLSHGAYHSLGPPSIPGRVDADTMVADHEHETACPDPSRPGEPDPATDQPVEFWRRGNQIFFYRPSEADEILGQILMLNPHPMTGTPQQFLLKRGEVSQASSASSSIFSQLKAALKVAAQAPVEGQVLITIDGYTPDFRPSSMRFEAVVDEGLFTGSINVVDENEDGIVDGSKVSGIPLVGTVESEVRLFDADSDGILDYQANYTFMTDGHESFLPLGDTNGDGEPDSISWDLDGDGEADPDLLFFPFTAGPSKPEVELKLHFAQFGDGRSGQTSIFSQISLFNLDTENPAEIKIILRDDNGDPLTVDLNGEVVVGEATYSIPAGGLKVLRSDGEGQLAVGSVVVCSDRAIGGVILFGGSVGLAGVGVSQVLTDGFVAPMEKSLTASINTGIAVTNLQDQLADLLLSLCDIEGAVLATATLQLAALGHRALFVDEINWEPEEGVKLDLSEFSGILKVASKKVAATVIQTQPGEFATQPVAPNFEKLEFGYARAAASIPGGADREPANSATGTSQELYFAQFGDGASGGTEILSQIILLNLTNRSANARLVFRDDDGALLETDLDGEMISGEKDLVIPPGALRVLGTDGTGSLVVGSVTVSSDQALAGVILFGGSAGVAGVGSSPLLPVGFEAPMESNTAAAVNTGIAVMNLESEDQTIEVRLFDSQGTLLATSQITLSAKGHRALFVNQFTWQAEPGVQLDFSEFNGLLKVSAAGETAATVIQTRPGIFATQPVVPPL
jgi:hypothetical protein